ncbi:MULTISPECIES: aminodeoxychorismate lyase [unclassified Bacillus (in: firmicutes)]|uniref:aminodeoxychorismate lyase n=1 Tax=unclassified Bacillus (in: firmicutes) TaxID=185979 RepID=UPI0008E36356|nr:MULTISPECIES: aminodeoxychorismate lyase [unclassified Bacillus (in: firmicutes)]SFB23011.1 4-amino-4-deoxychorismate lyase [Bacillus sp. UNCCL13]SFQ91134.1 4-amino-4-deoxychorismate lyase [Bacillus sp. cl95]
MFILLDGKLVEKEKAMISPFDHGYLYGVGLFETFRVYDGHCFLLDDHLERLNQGLSVLDIKKEFIREEVEGLVSQLLNANGYQDAYIRFNVSAGAGEIGLQTEPYLKPVTIVFAKPLPPASDLTEKEAVMLTLPRNTPEGAKRLKSHHYLNNLLAKREIGADPKIEGVFLTSEGYLAEGIVSNLFWLKDGILYTPSVDTGILDGVTRQLILELAIKNGIKVIEGFFLPEEATDADEIFFTNSIQEVVAVSAFKDRKKVGRAGGFVNELHNQYRNLTQHLYSRRQLKEELL